MSQRHDMCNEPHCFQRPPLPMNNHQDLNIHNNRNPINDNPIVYDNLGSRENMGKIQGERKNPEGKIDDL